MNGGCSVVCTNNSYEQVWINAIGLSYSDVISDHGAILLALGSRVTRTQGHTHTHTHTQPIQASHKTFSMLKLWPETLKLRVKFEDLGVGGGGWY
jgi:CDP-diacylglycerol pyrophosphatase